MMDRWSQAAAGVGFTSLLTGCATAVSDTGFVGTWERGKRVRSRYRCAWQMIGGTRKSSLEATSAIKFRTLADRLQG